VAKSSHVDAAVAIEVVERSAVLCLLHVLLARPAIAIRNRLILIDERERIQIVLVSLRMRASLARRCRISKSTEAKTGVTAIGVGEQADTDAHSVEDRLVT